MLYPVRPQEGRPGHGGGGGVDQQFTGAREGPILSDRPLDSHHYGRGRQPRRSVRRNPLRLITHQSGEETMEDLHLQLEIEHEDLVSIHIAHEPVGTVP